MASGEEGLSLNERLDRAISKLGFWYRVTIVMVIVGLVALSGIISASQIYFHQEVGKYGQIEEIFLDDGTSVIAFIPYTEEIFAAEGIVTLYITQIWLMVGNGIVIGLLSFLVIWVTFRGNTHTRELESIERQFVRQSYLVNFETSIPEGETRIEKILNHSSLVFPALKDLKQRDSRKIKIKQNIQVDGITVDVIIPTKKGDFIVKFYEETVTYENLKSLCKILSKSRGRIFRVLCIGKDFEKSLQSNQLVDLMEELQKYFKLDLIFEEDQGYSMLWID